MYKCISCKKVVSKLEPDKVRCPFCGARIFVKMRPEVVKKVRAR